MLPLVSVDFFARAALPDKNYSYGSYYDTGPTLDRGTEIGVCGRYSDALEVSGPNGPVQFCGPDGPDGAIASGDIVWTSLNHADWITPKHWIGWKARTHSPPPPPSLARSLPLHPLLHAPSHHARIGLPRVKRATHFAAAAHAAVAAVAAAVPVCQCQPSTARTTRTRCKSSSKSASISSLSWTSRLVCTRMSTLSNSTPPWTRVVRIQATQTPSPSTRPTTSRTASSLITILRTSSAASQPTRPPSLWSASAPCRPPPPPLPLVRRVLLVIVVRAEAKLVVVVVVELAARLHDLDPSEQPGEKVTPLQLWRAGEQRGKSGARRTLRSV